MEPARAVEQFAQELKYNMAFWSVNRLHLPGAPMNMRRKHGLAFYGAILSAVHFSLAVFLSELPLLTLRFEDMIGSGESKPYWPPSRLRDAVQGAADVITLPARWVYDSCPKLSDLFVVVVAILSSCLWGFALALILRVLFTRLRVNHEPHPA